MYRLKREFGVKCDVYKLLSTTMDFDTGEPSRTIQMTEVRRAVKMPEGVKQLQYISPNFTQTQKSFISKGLGWEEVTNMFLFEGSDLRNYRFDLSDWIVHDHERYDVQVVEELGSSAGWVVGTTLARGTPANEFHIRLVEQSVAMEGEGTSSVV